MKSIKMHIENNAILFRMIAVFSMIGATAILLLTTIMGSLYSSEIKTEIYNSQLQNIQQIANIVSFRAESVSALMLQVKENNKTSKLFFTTDTDEVREAISSVDNLRFSTNNLHSIYVYNEYKDLIYISSESGIPGTSTPATFMDQNFIDILNNIEQYPAYTPILRQLNLDWTYSKFYNTYVYTYLTYDTYSNGAIHNVVAFNFHLDWIEDALEFITTGQSNSNDIWIVDRNRQIVFTTTDSKIGTLCDEATFPDEIFQNESGYLITGNGKDRQMLVYATPSRNGYEDWTFISQNNYGALTQPLDHVKSSVYMVCALILLISLFTIIRSSRMIYEPVRLAIDRVALLEAEQEKKKKIEQMLFLRKLFLGTVIDDLDVIREKCNQHQITGELTGDIRVALISIDHLDQYLKKYVKTLDETSLLIEELIRQQFSKVYPKLISVKMHNGIWAVCFPAVMEDDPNIAVLFKSLNSILGESFGISASLAISSIGHSARDIPYLYSEVLIVSSYRYLYGHQRMITSGDVQSLNEGQFAYPSDIEKKLLSSLFNGKYTEVMDIYEEFVNAIRCASVEEMRLSFLMLAYAIKGASEKTMAETSSVMLEFDRFCKALHDAETISEVHTMYHNLFGDITDKLKLFSKERHEVLIERIKTFVQDNYSDSNLSMNQISDQVNMSAAYLGRLFKQVTGITFTEYLTKFRLAKACALLKDSNLTVNEISDAVGFTNSSYFYIIFKKNMECTPNQYRRQYQSSSNTDE